MSDDRDLSVPKKERLNYELAILRGLLGATFGGWTGAVLDFVIRPPHAKKMKAWQEALASNLCEQIVRGRTTQEQLAHHEQLKAAIVSATINAAATAAEEKLDALRNALINIAIAPDEDSPERRMFLGLVEELDVWHIRLLKFYSDPDPALARVGWTPKKGEEEHLHVALNRIYPNANIDSDLARAIVRDLKSRGLVDIQEQFQSIEITRRSVDAPHYLKETSKLGDRFLKFISLPEADVDLSGEHQR